MAIKPKQFIGIIVGISVVGVTIYAIKKYYDEKKQTEESFGVDEAKEIVEEGRANLNLDPIDPDMEETKMDSRNRAFVDTHFSNGDRDALDYESRVKHILDNAEKESAKTSGDLPLDYGSKNEQALSGDEMERLVDDARDDAHWKTTSWNPDSPIGIKPDELAATLEDIEEEEDLMDGPDPEEVQDSKGYYEEDKEVMDELRYAPDSVEAREQFINMELVVLGRDNDTRDVVSMLFDHPFKPLCDEDHNLMIRLVDHRIKFFGERSKWINEVTFGDVIMYYGKAAEYNCGEDVRHWVDYFLTCADMNNITITSDEIDERILELNKHTFFNYDLQAHGLFGLTAFQMTETIRVAQNRVDGMVTYDIEFHKFIEGIINR